MAKENLGQFTLEDDGTDLLIKDSGGNTVGRYDSTNATFIFDDAEVNTSPTESSDVAIKDYVDSVAQGLEWQESVLDEQNTPPGTPNTGDRYLINDSPTGAWSGEANEIAEWDGSQWIFTDPEEGFAVFLDDVDLLKVYNGSDWVAFGSAIDHGALAGLNDDDHTQYLLVDGTRAMSGVLDAVGIENTDYNEAVDTATAVSGTLTFDLSSSNWFERELDGDITISFSNVSSSPPGNSVTIYLEDTDGTGPHSISYPSGTEWPRGSATTSVASNSDVEIVMTTPDGGTTWRASERGVDWA